MDDRDDDELEAKMEEFLRLQAERESGADPPLSAPVASIWEACPAASSVN